ncbi:unnamed protein product [Orchesella dallaii]|uniref:KIND domain-containing protein n=1 Tax=Orchesella dallaii TaxID=48710 RepID=A0ABP1QYC3_9HEXA
MEPDVQEKVGPDVYDDSFISSHPLKCLSSRSPFDYDGYISLGSMLTTFSAPISEDHAWALCYLTYKFIDSTSSRIEKYTVEKQVSDMNFIKIHQEGHISLSVTPIQNHNANGNIHSENNPNKIITRAQIISRTAVIIYKALDFGMKEDEERSLSPELEKLLSAMSLADEHEFYQHQNTTGAKLFDVLRIKDDCLQRWNNATGDGMIFLCPDHYYENICRNLVSDAMEFAKFLRIAEQAARELKNLNNYNHYSRQVIQINTTKENFKVVAKMWIQIAREIKRGVKLRRLNESLFPIRSQKLDKTPHELLMDDIKAQRCRLKRVPTDEMCKARGRMDLHDMIMEYIRSQPKLKKTSERVLQPPPPKTPDPIEELMKSIRQVHHLRPVKRNSGKLNT